MNEDRKMVLFIAASLDGYIAREDGSLDWLYAVEGEGDNGFSEFYKTVDTLIMGRATYDHLMSMVDEFPHANRTCYVFSRTEQREEPYVRFINADAGSFTRDLLNQSGADIWLVGGADLLDAYLKDNLVDEYIITIAPVILGQGIPLFKSCKSEIALELIRQRKFGQFTQLHYRAKQHI